jgi:hypothetical protein
VTRGDRLVRRVACVSLQLVRYVHNTRGCKRLVALAA